MRRKLTESIETNTDRNAPVRKWQRFKVDVRVKVRRSEEPDTAAVVVRSCVISEGGMSVYAPQSMEIGTSVMVEFSLPGSSRELRLRALIRNRCGFRCGMEFVERMAADRMLIRGFSAVVSQRKR